MQTISGKRAEQFRPGQARPVYMTIGNLRIMGSLINQSVRKLLNRKSIYNKKINFTVVWKSLECIKFCFVVGISVVIFKQATPYFSYVS